MKVGHSVTLFIIILQNCMFKGIVSLITEIKYMYNIIRPFFRKYGYKNIAFEELRACNLIRTRNSLVF